MINSVVRIAGKSLRGDIFLNNTFNLFKEFIIFFFYTGNPFYGDKMRLFRYFNINRSCIKEPFKYFLMIHNIIYFEIFWLLFFLVIFTYLELFDFNKIFKSNIFICLKFFDWKFNFSVGAVWFKKQFLKNWK